MTENTNVIFDTVPVRIRREVKDQLKRYANENGRKIQWVVNQAVSEYLAKLEGAKHDQSTIDTLHAAR